MVNEITSEDLKHGPLELYARATSGGIFKYYIASEGDVVINKSVIDFTDWQLESIRSINKRANDEFGLTLTETSNRGEATFIIYMLSDLEMAGLGYNDGLHLFLVENSNIGFYKLSMSWFRSIPENSEEVSQFIKDDWTKIYIHELGHTLGLEHPWDKRDGDWFADGPDEVSSNGSVMEYISTDTEGNFYKWFSEIDIKALEEIWGKAGDVPPILSISPYSKLADRVTENPTNQIFLANNDGESVTINYSYSDIKNKMLEDNQNGNRFYAGTASEGIYLVQHPDIGSDYFVGFSEIVFTDQTIILNIPNSKSEYPNPNGEVTSGLTEGAYLKYSLSNSLDDSKNTLKAHTENVLSGTLNFNDGDNIIILDGQAKTYRGLSGDDTYFVSQLLPEKGKVSITDTEGTNTIQIPSNTYIDKTLFTKNATRLTLENGREITINKADSFTYNVGGNKVDGTVGQDLTFSEFAKTFGITDVLNLSSSENGFYADMYII